MSQLAFQHTNGEIEVEASIGPHLANLLRSFPRRDAGTVAGNVQNLFYLIITSLVLTTLLFTQLASAVVACDSALTGIFDFVSSVAAGLFFRCFTGLRGTVVWFMNENLFSNVVKNVMLLAWVTFAYSVSLRKYFVFTIFSSLFLTPIEFCIQMMSFGYSMDARESFMNWLCLAEFFLFALIATVFSSPPGFQDFSFLEILLFLRYSSLDSLILGMRTIATASLRQRYPGSPTYPEYAGPVIDLIRASLRFMLCVISSTRLSTLWFQAFLMHETIAVSTSVFQLFRVLVLFYQISTRFPKIASEKLASLSPDDTCSICLCSHNLESCVLPCKHIVHSSCVTRLLSVNGGDRCPVCRTSLFPNNNNNGSENTMNNNSNNNSNNNPTVEVSNALSTNGPGNSILAEADGSNATSSVGQISTSSNSSRVFAIGQRRVPVQEMTTRFGSIPSSAPSSTVFIRNRSETSANQNGSSISNLQRNCGSTLQTPSAPVTVVVNSRGNQFQTSTRIMPVRPFRVLRSVVNDDLSSSVSRTPEMGSSTFNDRNMAELRPEGMSHCRQDGNVGVIDEPVPTVEFLESGKRRRVIVSQSENNYSDLIRGVDFVTNQKNEDSGRVSAVATRRRRSSRVSERDSRDEEMLSIAAGVKRRRSQGKDSGKC